MRYLFIVIGFWVFTNVLAQTNPTTNNQSQNSSIEQIMIQSMKDEGMTQQEIDEALKAMRANMQVVEDLNEQGVTIGVAQTDLKIPVKQIKLLSDMPVLTSATIYESYLNKLLSESAKNTTAAIITEVDRLIQTNPDDADLGIMLFLKGEIHASVYASIKLAQKNTGNLLIQNNLAFVLNQTGYPHKAIPIFKNLLDKQKNDNLANNLAQCYLALGDKDNAKKYFTFGLAINPNHCEMNCGMGLIMSDEGKNPETVRYITKSLENGYTKAAHGLAKKHEVKIKYSNVKSQVPEYFNPQKHKPVQAAANMEEVLNIELQRESFSDLVQEWAVKSEALNNAYNDQDSSSVLAENLGFIANTLFSGKATFMLDIIADDMLEFAAKNDYVKYQQLENEYKAELDKGLKDMYVSASYENMYEECAKKVELLNIYLQKSKNNHDSYERKVLPKFYDWTNQSLFWRSFLMSGNTYKNYYTSEVYEFLFKLESLDKLQNLYPTPDWIASNCKDYKKKLEKIKQEKIEEQLNCPVNLKVGAGIASFKMNCKGYEIEGGELGKLSFEKDFQTGEFQIAFGLGADINVGPLSAGSKGMFFMRFASDFAPVDMGMKGEVGMEAQLGTFTVEEKLSGTMGISSINIDAVHLGQEHKIFAMDAVKD